MKLLVLYHFESEQSTPIEDYLKEINKNTTKEVIKYNLETLEGSAVAKLYDIVRYPALLVVRDDGQLIKFWQGKELPLVEEVAGYLNA